jgi:hypothetical protein
MSDVEQWAGHDAALKKLSGDVEKRIADDLNAASASAIHADTVYHYTDLASALAIMETGCLWFAERAHLNDTLELQYGLHIGQEIFRGAVKAGGPTVPQDAADHLMGELGQGLADLGFWVASFSLEGDDLSQWRSYADDGRGVCLGFAVQQLDMSQFASSVSVPLNYLRFPVRYGEEELRKDVKPYVDMSVDLLRRVNLPTMPSYSKPYGQALLFERDLLRAMMDGIYLHSLLHKHRAYEHEREYRLMLSGYRLKVEPSPRHKVRTRGGEIVDYLDLPIPNWKSSGRTHVTRVKVGPAAPLKLEEQLATAFRSLQLPAPQIDRSTLPFRRTR